MARHRLAGRVLAGMATITLVAGCATGTMTPGPRASAPPSEAAATQPRSITAAPPPAAPSSSPTAANEWPFVRASCPGASGQPLLLVALGTSETAGWRIRTDEPYSPQEAYPAQYADILCKELGVPVELRSYFPSQLGNELAPLAFWNWHVANDPAMRADLAAAKIVVLWAMGSHDIGPAILGGCSGDWPDPLKTCFEAATAKIPAETDRLFTAIAGLVPTGATVLAAAPYGLPLVIERWGAEPYWEEMKPIFERITDRPLVGKHGFTLVDLEVAFNGPTLDAMPADGLFQSDGIHPTVAGALAVAKVFAKSDGLGD
jgi:hypothetical protein